MKQPEAVAPEQTTGGPTPESAYRRPNGEAPRDAGDPLVLPPGTSSQKFKDFTLRLTDIVGSDNVTVISKDEELWQESYLEPSKAHDMFHVLEKQYFVASAVVVPQDVPETQEVVKLCNEFEIPLWPFSIGRNVGYGGAAPRVPGSIGLTWVGI